MTSPSQEAQLAIQNARRALSGGEPGQARQWAERAAKLAPQLEDPWLILAAVAGPRQGLQYIQKALQVNPDSPRARRGMEWVMQRLQTSDEGPADTQRTGAVGSIRQAPSAPPSRAGSKSPMRGGLVLAGFLLIAGCAVLGLAGWIGIRSPAVAAMIVRPVLAAEPTQMPQWAEAVIPKPTYTAAAPMVEVIAATPTPEPAETAMAEQTEVTEDASAGSPAELPTATGQAGEQQLPTAEPTWSGSLSMEYVQDTPTPEAPPYVPPTEVQPDSGGDMATGTHWIDVNLTQQMVYAYAGDTVVNSFLASTGTWMTPTVTGKYRIWIKLRSSDMSGPDYYLPDVPYVMYFYKDYGIHGTYWHNNFGTPMSHGCVNLSIPDAEWLYNFSYEGTVVNVHY
jgi:lipoprotein-anchoring transpeptidase ErfK/SrfK